MQHLFSSFLRFWLIPLTGGSLVLLSALPAMPQITRPQVQSVTVRIDRPPKSGIAAAGGSGVLVKQVGNEYSVLTNCHVIKANPGTYTLWINGNDRYSVSVPDPIRLCHSRVDLAVLTFNSTQRYSIATLRPERDIKVLVNEQTSITAAGFPNPYDGSATRSDLLFDPSGGSVVQIRNDVTDGYELVHNITTLDGMSGGPIFDDQGKLIAINGQTIRSNTGIAPSSYYAAIPIHYYTSWQSKTPESLGADIRTYSNQQTLEDLDDANTLDPVAEMETRIDRRSEELLQRAVDRSLYDIIGAIEMAETIPEGTSGSEQARLYLEFWRKAAGVAPSPSTPPSIEPYRTHLISSLQLVV